MEEKLRNSDVARAETQCKSYCCWLPRVLETYHKLKKKPWTIAELQTTLQKIWNEVPQKPVVNAVQNFRRCLQACVNKAG